MVSIEQWRELQRQNAKQRAEEAERNNDPAALAEVLDETTMPEPTWVRRRRQEREEEMRRRITYTTESVHMEVEDARMAAHRKHGENSIEAVTATDFGKWLAILGEEFGEVCHSLTYDQSTTMGELMSKLRAELIDTITVGVAWVAAVDDWMAPNGTEEEDA